MENELSVIYTTVIPKELERLHELAKGKKICVEIGSYLGASARAISHGFNPDQILYCIDIWESDISKRFDPPSGTIYENFLKNTEGYNVFPIRSYSKDAVFFFIKSNLEIDFLFIDGDHSKEGIQIDWDCYYPLMKRGGVMVFHDYAWETIRNLVHRQVEAGKLKGLEAMTNMCWGRA